MHRALWFCHFCGLSHGFGMPFISRIWRWILCLSHGSDTFILGSISRIWHAICVRWEIVDLRGIFVHWLRPFNPGISGYFGLRRGGGAIRILNFLIRCRWCSVFWGWDQVILMGLEETPRKNLKVIFSF
jgi:hypothetical protein